MLDLINTAFQYWFIILWIIGIIAGWVFGGWRLALAAATLGLGAVSYKLGKKVERDNQEDRIDHIQKEREKAYEEIDRTPVSRSDASKRLRDGRF